MAETQEVNLSRHWIDVSIPIRTGMVHWPTDPPCEITRVKSIGAGDIANLSELRMSAHTGTHMDAPLHFLDGAASIDRMPIEATTGLARVIEIEDPVSIKPSELDGLGIEYGERLLFKTANSARWRKTDQFFEDYVYVSPEAAMFLAAKRPLCVGVDYLSVGGFAKGNPETHRALLGAGVWIIEGLNLADVAGGHYELVCLPLKLAGAEGAPARAILRRDG